MKKSILNKARWLFLSILAIMCSIHVWADTANFIWCTTGQTMTTTSGTQGKIDLTSAGNSASAPAVISNQLRLYYHSSGNGGSVTVTAQTGYQITAVSIYSTLNPTLGYKINNGSYSTKSWSSTTSYNASYTASLTSLEASSVTFQNQNTTNTHIRITALIVTYESTGSGVCDYLNKAFTGNPSNYTSWSGKKGSASNAVYAGNSSGGNSAIQIRGSDNSGIITTTSGGTATSVEVTWESHTYNGRTLQVYGKNTAYSAVSDLYSNTPATQGTLLGTIVYGTSTSLDIDGSYAYLGLRSSANAMYLTDITICWEDASCAAPTSPTSSTISATGFTATWTAPSSAPANGYYVAYSTSSTPPGDITASSGDYTVVSVGAGTTEKAISGLTDGGLYYFWVRSRCSASDNSGWSDRAQVQLSKITLSQESLTGMTYVYNGASGGPSSQTKSFTVTGTNVGGNLTVSAPTYFQVSTDNSSWGSSKTITATSGSASGIVYVRLAGGLNAGSYGSESTYVTVSDGGSKASSKNVSVQGSVTKATLNPSFGSATYNITRDVSTSTSFTLTNVPSDYTGAITYQRTNSPTYSSYLTIDGSEKTFTASSSGSWTVTAQFAADANYNAKASGVTCTVNAVTRDTYVDNVNGQSVSEAQRTDDGVNPYTSPALSDVAAGSACGGTKTHLIGWATATFIANVGNGTLTGADSDYTEANGFYAVGATLPAASGVTYYAVYGEEE